MDFVSALSPTAPSTPVMKTSKSLTSSILTLVCSTGIMSVALIIVSLLTKLYGDSPDTAASAAQFTLIFIFYGSYSFVWTL